jgi:membrane-bound metal-dependent hydrolase YbcI (DUF457 family)
MYFFFHLITGVLLGFLAGDLLHDNRWVIPCAIGSILPDLVDKPLGYFLLPALTGQGRLLFHSLPLLLIVVAVGVSLWKYRGSVAPLAAGIGILSHQVLDTMWTEPVQWFDPILEPVAVPRTAHLDYFLLLLERDLGNPTEWFMAGILILGLLLYTRREHIRSVAKAHGRGICLVLQGLAVSLAILGGLLVSYGMLRTIRSLSPRFMLNYAFPLIAVLALASFLFWRWGSALGSIQGGREA